MSVLFHVRPITIAPGAARPLPGRWIDPRAQRFGAATSALVLLIGLALGWWPIVGLVGLALGASAALGTHWFVLSRPWPMIRQALALGPHELEHEVPPRFAQALGAVFLALGVALLLAGVEPWGWLPVAAVIGLQLLLAVTGYCLGCRLFFLRWYVPDLFLRVVGRGVPRERMVYVDR